MSVLTDVGTPTHPQLVGAVVVVRRAAALDRILDPVEAAVETKIHDAGNGIGAVRGGSAASDCFDALNERLWNDTHVDSAELVARAKAVPIEQH